MDRTFIFLGGLCDEFESIQSQILNCDEIPAIEEVYARVESEEQRRQIMHIDSSQGSSPAAFVSRTSGTGQRPARRCSHCNKLGHSVDFCWDLHPEKRLVRGCPPPSRRAPFVPESSQSSSSNVVKSKLSSDQLKGLQAYISRLSTQDDTSTSEGANHMDGDPVDDQSTSRDHLFGLAYTRKKTDVVETDVVANIVGLVGSQIYIWRRHGKQSILVSSKGQFSRGYCMRYMDPEAVIGCGDGTVRVYDMYSRACSQIIRMHAGPITCLSLSDHQFIISGSSLGSITVADLSSEQNVASLKTSTSPTGISSLCFNQGSYYVFAGSTSGFAHCWDLRTLKPFWETRASPNVLYSMHHLLNDTSSLAVGGIDGVLRIMDPNTGNVLSSYVPGGVVNRSTFSGGLVQRNVRSLSQDSRIDVIPKKFRPPITSLAVGMEKNGWRAATGRLVN
ncbi:F-box/WD-40 repeat-containing protein [Nymphaea thermarum]|nr:F-box/WD-40 repeat-containing protein [Nymphaea thermarum]